MTETEDITKENHTTQSPSKLHQPLLSPHQPFLSTSLLSSSADLSPGILRTNPTETSPTSPLQQSFPVQSPNTHPFPYNEIDQPTPRPGSTSLSHLLPPPSHSHPDSSSRPDSIASSRLSISLYSPLCTPKIRDFAYPRTHKYHAPNFNSRRVSISSRSSTSSDLDFLFPTRLAGAIVTETFEGREQEWNEEDLEDVFPEDGDEEEIVERRAICVFDFVAECEGEISIESGQVVWVEFRKGKSGWLVVRDEFTGAFLLHLLVFCSCLLFLSFALVFVLGCVCAYLLVVMLIVGSKGLVPEGYVKFLTSDEERQYLSQNPPTNTLLPQFPGTNHIPNTDGQETPTLKTWPQASQQWSIQEEDTTGDEDEWIDEPNEEQVDSVTEAIEKVHVEI